jgi:hypothetical protein
MHWEEEKWEEEDEEIKRKKIDTKPINAYLMCHASQKNDISVVFL